MLLVYILILIVAGLVSFWVAYRWTRYGSLSKSLQQAAIQRLQMMESTKLAFEACEQMASVKYCMMLENIHDNMEVKAVLRRHGVASVPLLAQKAWDTAERALNASKKFTQ